MNMFDVSEFGAHGNGEDLETAALQAAVDACHAAGGGTVCVGPGIHRTGTLFLKSHVELHLQAGAVLQGSADRKDYNADEIFPENEVFTFENTTGAHLLIAYKAENVAITGNGTIDGNSSVFLGDIPESDRVGSYRYKRENFPILDWRPSQMLFFCRCSNVVLRDVSMLNAPYWTCFLLGCEDVRISGLLIENPPETPNGDGLDIDCCRNVSVSDCIIRSGDDSITLRGNSRPLGDNAIPCENVVVTNCVLSSPCNAIRIGVGDGIVRDCVFSNIVVNDSRTGINIMARYADIFPTGVRIERIRFSNFRMGTVVPVHAHVGAGSTPPVGIRDIDFHGFLATAQAGFIMSGEPDCPLERIRFSDWDLCVSGGTDCMKYAEHIPDPFSCHWSVGVDGRPALPSAVVVRNGRDISFRDVRVRWGEKLGKIWQHAMHLENIEGCELRHVEAPAPRTGQPADILLQNVEPRSGS